MDPFILATVGIAFLLGGVVKGVIGLGLPLTSVAVMSTVLDLRVAIPLLVIPVTVTNVWQALRGGRLIELLALYWPMLVAAAIGVWVGTLALYRVDPSLLLVLLGVVVCGYALINLIAVEIAFSPRHVRVVSPMVGLVSGLLSGTTGSLGLPIVIYLQGLGLAKDVLVQAMGIQFFTTGVVWTAALFDQRGINAGNLPISALALVPAVAGMIAGQWLRERLSPERFRFWLFVFLFAVGLNLIRKGLF